MSTTFRQNFDRVKSEHQEQQYYSATYSNADQQQRSTRSPPSFFRAGGQSPQYPDHENGYDDEDESQEYSLSEFSHIHLADGTLEADNSQPHWLQINGGHRDANGSGPTSFAEHHNSQQQRIQEAFAAHNAGVLNSQSHLSVSPSSKDQSQDQLDTSNVGTSSNRKRALSFNNGSKNYGVNGNSEKRTATKICRVCGDKAYSYNFNVITCESCKAFFRRNANKEKEIRCPFNEQCDINIVSRRFCQRCRLQKCFRVGMKKEWIMSEEARLEKKQRIQDNRERRMAERQHVSGSTEELSNNNVTATAIANPMENILMNVTEPPSLQNHLELQSNTVPSSLVPIPGNIVPMNGPPTNLIAPTIGEESLAAHAAQVLTAAAAAAVSQVAAQLTGNNAGNPPGEVQTQHNNPVQPGDPQAQPAVSTTSQNGDSGGSMAAGNAESVPTLNQTPAAPTITTTTLCSPLFPTESATQSAMNNFGQAPANTTMITTNEQTQVALQAAAVAAAAQQQNNAQAVPSSLMAAAAAANQQLANHQPQMVSAAAVHAHLQAAAVQAQLQEHQHQLLAAQQAQLQQAAAQQLLHNAAQSQQTIHQQQQQHAVAAAAAQQIVAHQQQQAVVAAQLQQQQIAAQIAASCHIPQPTQAQPTLAPTTMVQPQPPQSTIVGQPTVVDLVTGTQPAVPSTTALHQSIMAANNLVSSGAGQPVMSTMQSNALSQPQSILQPAHPTFMDPAASIIPPQTQPSSVTVLSTMQQTAPPAPQPTLISQQMLEAAAAAQPPPSSSSQELVAIPKDVLMKLVEHKIENEQQQQQQKLEESKPAKCQCHCQCGRYPIDMLIVDKVMTDLLENSSKQFDEQRRTACASASSSISNFGRMDTSSSNHTPPSFFHSPAAGTPIQQNKPFDMEIKINPADYCPLTLSDQDSLNELVQVNAIWNSEPCDIQCGVTENGLRRLVRMISSVPVFRGLDRHDQTLLLKHGCESYFVLRGTSSYNDSKIQYLLQNRVSESIINFYKDFPAEWRSNETIILLFGMILLFDAQVPELHNQISVTVERMKYESIAKRVLYTLCGQDVQRAASAFTDLVNRLEHLKSIATLCQSENFEPIVQQMFEPPAPPPATTAMDSIINMSTM